MTISKGKVVTINYQLTNKSGEELDKSEPNDPLVYLHGVGQLVPGLEKALEGLKEGDAKDKIEVAPSEGYGEVRAELILKVGRDQFPSETELEQGMRFWAHTPEGQRHPFTVVGIEGDQVEIDGNHPLAGETLIFDISIVGIREATKEEMEHGHAHGPGGHQH